MEVRKNIRLAVLGGAMLVLSAGAAAQFESNSTPRLDAQVAAPAPTSAVAPDQGFTGTLANLVGSWLRRDASLWVFRDGEARLRWLTSWCDMTTDSVCDRTDDNQLVIGALAELQSSYANEAPTPSLEGEVVSINKQGPVHVGPVTLTQIAQDAFELEQDSHRLVLCRPPRDVNDCEATDVHRWRPTAFLRGPRAPKQAPSAHRTD